MKNVLYLELWTDSLEYWDQTCFYDFSYKEELMDQLINEKM